MVFFRLKLIHSPRLLCLISEAASDCFYRNWGFEWPLQRWVAVPVGDWFLFMRRDLFRHIALCTFSHSTWYEWIFCVILVFGCSTVFWNKHNRNHNVPFNKVNEVKNNFNVCTKLRIWACAKRLLVRTLHCALKHGTSLKVTTTRLVL